ncbi:hypothetical protein CPC08DRAFT_762252 [Agrocybe pediades]|nr:hypothetical protein CPC08DRAFT_762252 [Agrocybe pediades]
MGSVLTIDDRDPAVVYNAMHWGQEPEPSGFNGTSTFCGLVNGTARYDFSGSPTFAVGGPATISVFGLLKAASFQPSGRTSYSIDGSAPEIFVPAPGDTDTFNVKFYEASVPEGNHTLLITTLDGDGSTVYLDFLQLAQQPQLIASVPAHSGSDNGASVNVQVTTITNSQGGGIMTLTQTEMANAPAQPTQATGSDSSSSSAGTAGGTSGSSSQTESENLRHLTTIISGITFTADIPATASFPSPTGTTSVVQQDLGATTHHSSSVGVIVGPIMGILVLFCLLMLGGLCYARAWRKRVLMSKEEEVEAGMQATSESSADESEEHNATAPASTFSLSRWTTSATRSVSPFVLGERNARAPPPYLEKAGNLEVPVVHE